MIACIAAKPRFATTRPISENAILLEGVGGGGRIAQCVVMVGPTLAVAARTRALRGPAAGRVAECTAVGDLAETEERLATRGGAVAFVASTETVLFRLLVCRDYGG